jgi:hypothetical protein
VRRERLEPAHFSELPVRREAPPPANEADRALVLDFAAKA